MKDAGMNGQTRDPGSVVRIFIFAWTVVRHVLRVLVLGATPEAVRVLPAEVIQHQREAVLRLRYIVGLSKQTVPLNENKRPTPSRRN